MPKQRPHMYDEVADDILGWMDDSVDYFSEAIRGGQRAPFSASVSEQDKLDYYRRQVFKMNQDGTVNYEAPNETGREMLLNRVGIRGYTDVMNAVLQDRNKQNSQMSYTTVDPYEPPEEEDEE